jgi:hypothetical protein
MSQVTRMLDSFASVGAQTVEVTVTDFQGEIVSYRPSVTIDNFKPTADQLVARAKRELLNVIIRPRSGMPLVQLDDISIETVERVRTFSFLAYETSPGNNQAWFALERADEDFPRRLRKGVGADPGASGASPS